MKRYEIISGDSPKWWAKEVPTGHWCNADDAAARISDLEAQLAELQTENTKLKNRYANRNEAVLAERNKLREQLAEPYTYIWYPSWQPYYYTPPPWWTPWYWDFYNQQWVQKWEWKNE